MLFVTSFTVKLPVTANLPSTSATLVITNLEVAYVATSKKSGEDKCPTIFAAPPASKSKFLIEDMSIIKDPPVNFPASKLNDPSFNTIVPS